MSGKSWIFGGIGLALLVGLMSAPLRAQAATRSQGALLLSVTPAQLGSEIVVKLRGVPLSPWMIGVDRETGVTPIYGGTLWLGMTSKFAIPFSSADEHRLPLSREGLAEIRIPIPDIPGLEGERYYLQAVAGDRQSASGWAISNAVSVEPAPANSLRPLQSDIVQARSFHQATPLARGGILISGGGSGPLFDTEAMQGCELFDPFTRSWASTTPMLVDRKLHTATPLDDGRLYVCGGVGCDGKVRATSELFDLDAMTWSFGPKLRAARVSGSCSATVGGRVGHQATRLADGRVLITGGSSAFATNSAFSPLQCFYRSASRSAEIFDPRTNRSTPLPLMGEARTLHQQILMSDGSVLIVGGIREADRFAPGDVPIYTETLELFDPETNSFSFVGFLGGRIGHSVIELAGGNIMVIGGLAGDKPQTLNSVLSYSLSLGVVTSDSRLPNGNGGIAFHTSTRLDSGEVWMAGGAYGQLLGLRSRSETWVFSPERGFEQSASFMSPRFGATTTALPLGLLTVGGSDGLRASRLSADAGLWMPPRLAPERSELKTTPWYERVRRFAVQSLFD